MKYIAAMALLGFTLYIGVMAGNLISDKRKPKDNNLNPQGFDDGNEDDNHLHI